MRLFAIGGTSFDERKRLGDWQLDAAVFKAPLPARKPAFGFGCAWIDGDLILIVRQMQLDAGKRESPFTLLIDPGAEIWERIGWNPSALAWNLFSSEEAAGYSLLQRPEEATLPGLAKLLADSVRLTAPAEISAEFSAGWLQALCADGLMRVSPAMLGLAAMPSAEQMAGLLASLPTAFRAGGGWGLNLGPDVAEALNMRLVLRKDASEVGSAWEERHHLWKLWSRAVANRADLRPLAQVPTPFWPERFGITVTEAFRRLKLFEALEAVTPEQPVESLLEAVEAIAPDKTPLAHSIRQAAHELALRSREPGLPVDRTRANFLLREAQAKRLTLLPIQAGQIPEEAIVDFFDRQRLRPNEATFFPMEETTRAAVWIRLLHAANERREIEELLVSAFGNLSSEKFAGLSAVVVSHALVRDHVADWRRFLDAHDGIRECIEPLFEKEAVRHVVARALGWEHAFLAFCNTPTGEQVARDSLKLPDLEHLLAVAAELVGRPAEPLQTAARSWRNNLAASSLRAILTPAQKERLVKEKVAGWQYFNRLLHYFRGIPLLERAVPRPDRAERDRLECDLRQLISVGSPETAPALSEIYDLLTPPSEDLLQQLVRLPVPLADENGPRWIEALRGLDMKEAADEALDRMLKEFVVVLVRAVRQENSFNPSSEGLAPAILVYCLRHGSDEQLRRHFAAHVFGGDAPLAASRMLFSLWMEAARDSATHGDRLWEVLRYAMGSPPTAAQVEPFAIRFGIGFADFSKVLLQLPPDAQTMVLSIRAFHHPAHVKRELEFAFQNWRRDHRPDRLSAYERALLRHVASDTSKNGRGLRRHLADSFLGGPSEEDSVEDSLQPLLAPAEPAALIQKASGSPKPRNTRKKRESVFDVWLPWRKDKR